AILEYGQTHPECAGMGTTCTVLAVRGGQAWLAHVGDSRAYLLRGATIRQLSEDQTLIRKLVRDGMMTEEEALVSDQNNVLLPAPTIRKAARRAASRSPELNSQRNRRAGFPHSRDRYEHRPHGWPIRDPGLARGGRHRPGSRRARYDARP